MVVYKESQELAKKDPKLDVIFRSPKIFTHIHISQEWTGTFRDGRSINPLGAQPENALTGTIFTVNAWRHDALEVPSEFAGLRFWRHTSIADMQEVRFKFTLWNDSKYLGRGESDKARIAWPRVGRGPGQWIQVIVGK